MKTSVETRTKEVIAIDEKIEELTRSRELLVARHQASCKHERIAEDRTPADVARICVDCGVTEAAEGWGFHALVVGGPLSLHITTEAFRKAQEGYRVELDAKRRIARKETTLEAVLQDVLREKEGRLL